jgi:murein DD-endopeptidase MepM/ murein hydrolase activator NlpD
MKKALAKISLVKVIASTSVLMGMSLPSEISSSMIMMSIPAPIITTIPTEEKVCIPVSNPISALVSSERITSRYGWRIHPVTEMPSFHTGLDISAPKGRRVFPVAPGKVVETEKGKYYGRVITIDHGHGITSKYAHLSEINVEEGDEVNLTTIIGRVGLSGRTTGPHLHFELRVVGETINPAKATELFARIIGE